MSVGSFQVNKVTFGQHSKKKLADIFLEGNGARGHTIVCLFVCLSGKIVINMFFFFPYCHWVCFGLCGPDGSEWIAKKLGVTGC